MPFKIVLVRDVEIRQKAGKYYESCMCHAFCSSNKRLTDSKLLWIDHLGRGELLGFDGLCNTMVTFMQVTHALSIYHMLAKYIATMSRPCVFGDPFSKSESTTVERMLVVSRQHAMFSVSSFVDVVEAPPRSRASPCNKAVSQIKG